MGRSSKTSPLSHLDAAGQARMVDVAAKPESRRTARASARVRVAPSTLEIVARGDAPKGDVLGTARLAGIQGAKRTADLIPLCHPIALTSVAVDCVLEQPDLIVVKTEVECVGRTGVEMEAMAAASIAALTIYDMVKGVDRSARIESVVLDHKSGGKSGEWNRDSEGPG